MKSFFLFLILICFITPLWAEQTEGKFALGVKGGLETYWGDIDDQQIKPVVNGSLFYWISDYWALGFNGGWGYLLADDNLDYFKTDIYNINLMAKWKPWADSPLNPYLTAGIEIFSVNPKAANGNLLPNLTAEKYDKTNVSIPIGIGFSVFLSETIALDLEGIHHFSTTDYLDDLAEGTKKDGWTTFMAGLSLYLGEPKDTDKDGIPDKFDSDPFRAEDFDGFKDGDGAPDYDNDDDGVLDKDDKEPNNPEDKDGFEDLDGIPDPDNDQDGILDENDKEPDAAEDIDGFQDEDGAPDPDNDGDGILDVDDQCPNEAETINGYNDEDGCPDNKPEIDVEKGASLVLEGVNFASGKSVLTEGSKIILDKVVRTLAENQQIEVEIRGYTDNTGGYETNKKISQARAEAVKTYLVQNGIQAARILTFGFGPEKPIAPNNTKDGRAKNRRIEFYRIK